MPAREVAERLGHKKASMSLDGYTHVMPPDEPDKPDVGDPSAPTREREEVN
jgi:hypothetical protein